MTQHELLEILHSFKRVRVVRLEEDYIHAEFVKLIKPAQHFCKNCGRSAVSADNLCNPEELA